MLGRRHFTQQPLNVNLPQEPQGNEPILASWGRQLIKYVRSITPNSSPQVLYNTTANGTTATILDKKGSGGGSTDLPLEVHSTGALEVKVRAGYVFWHDKIITVPLSSAIIVPGSSTAFRVWLSLNDEFSTSTPTVTHNSGASGWSGYSAQPNPPAVRHFLLAEIASSSTAITTIDKKWNGGDIIWPPVFGFWG